MSLSQLTDQYRTKEIDRRQFIKQLSILGVSTALIPSFLSGTARAETPKKGGHFRMGMAGGSTTDSLDAAVVNAQVDSSTNYALRNNLVEVDHLGRALPELAESWDVSKDVTTWSFKLRRGVEFHNGKTMDADDVIYSIRHHMGPDSKSGAKGLLGQIADIQKDGPHGVIFKLKAGNADFPYVLNDYHLVIVPAGTTGADWETGVGTGGYVLEDWEPGVRTLLKRNPNYFKSDRAHFESVEILTIPDVNSRTNAMRSGQIDYMNRVELKTVHLFKRTPNVKILQVKGANHYTLPMQTDRAPFNNNDLRLAMKYACDRELLVKKFLRGFGVPGNDHPISPANKYYAGDLEQRQYDPDKAAFYLKKAGLSGETFVLHSSEENGFMDVSTLYAESARKAGISIRVKKEPSDGYWSNIWLKKSFCNSFWAPRPTA
ncbi:MAG: ABC transporter substrate-binding protein, partial [Desulfobacterales bacterium]|nr:ABC transporter substrate-binding protein [Desulfobacterales bacterium]